MDALKNMAGGDPAEAVKAIAAKMKEDVMSSGMDKAEAFVDKLEDLKEKAKAGPGEIMDKIQGLMEEFKNRLNAIMEDPGSLAGGGTLAACATWYGNAVVERLKSIASSFEELFQTMKKTAQDLAGPLKDIGNTMGEAMAAITKTVKGLSSLPGEVQSLADKVTGPNDLKDVKTDKMKSSCDTSGLEAPLGSLEGLKEKMGPLVDGAKSGVEQVTDFVGSAPDQIRNAFAVPSPLCCVNAAPPAMKELLDKVEAIAKFDLQPMLDMLGGLNENMGSLDVSKVKDPVSKFAEMAKDQIGNLDKAVSASKMASKGGALGGFKPF